MEKSCCSESVLYLNSFYFKQMFHVILCLIILNLIQMCMIHFHGCVEHCPLLHLFQSASHFSHLIHESLMEMKALFDE